MQTACQSGRTVLSSGKADVYKRNNKVGESVKGAELWVSADRLEGIQGLISP